MYFFYQHTKYIWNVEIKAYVTLDELASPVTVGDYANNTDGLTEEVYHNKYIKVFKVLLILLTNTVCFRLSLYGFNKIEVEVKSYWTLLIEEVLNPFYLFQAFSVILWLLDDYIPYAICVIILTLFSSVTSLVQTRRVMETLKILYKIPI